MFRVLVYTFCVCCFLLVAFFSFIIFFFFFFFLFSFFYYSFFFLLFFFFLFFFLLFFSFLFSFFRWASVLVFARLLEIPFLFAKAHTTRTRRRTEMRYNKIKTENLQTREKQTRQVSEAQQTLTAEAKRRQAVLDKRKERERRDVQAAERHDRLEAAGRLVEVEVTGTFEASARCLFLFDRARTTIGVSLSSDLGTAACSSSGNRGMVLGSRGFRGGVHYWEVRRLCFRGEGGGGGAGVRSNLARRLHGTARRTKTALATNGWSTRGNFDCADFYFILTLCPISPPGQA